MKKAIASKYTEMVEIIERTEYSDTVEHYSHDRGIERITRREWRSTDWSDAFVYVRGAFYELTMDQTATISEYRALTTNDLRAMVEKAMNRRAYSDNIGDYSFEEVSQMRALAVLKYGADEMERWTSVAQTMLTNAVEAIAQAAQHISDTEPEPEPETTRKGYAEKAAGYIVAELMDAYVKATGMTWSKYVETHDDEQAQALYRVASVEIIPEPERPAGYETASPEDYAAVAAVVSVIATDALEQVATDAMNAANVAMGEASDALSKTIEAAINYDPETAAKYAKQAEEAAQRAEAAAKRAASMDPTTAIVVYEEAAWARAYADRATETAEQSAAEAAELKDTDAYAHSAKTYANSTAWTFDRMTKDHPETAAELAHFARVCADAAHDAADNAAASYEYSRHTYYANYQTSAYDARALEIRAEQRDDAQREAQRAEETAQKIEALAAIEDQQQREYYAAEAIAHQWTPEETRENIAYYAAIRTAIEATRAFLAAYADAIGETVNDNDPEARAAYHVARDEMTSASIRATAADRETVDAMVERIAQAVRNDIPTGPEDYHGEHIGDPLAKHRSVEYLEFDAPRPTYQRAELLAYLGEPDDYDVTAIEHEATAYDPATGRTVWTVDAETLAAIAERHQLQFYAPAF